MNVKTILNLIGEQIVEDIKSELKPDYRIIKTIGYELVENGDRTDILIKAADYFKYIDKGRRPGAKFPPKKAIEEFVKRNNIPTEAIFPIQRKIAKDGIKPKNILDKVIGMNDTNFSSELEKGLLVQINDELRLIFNSNY